LGSFQRITALPATVADALSVSLDLDVELVAGSRWRLRALRGGYGYRTSGVMARGEMVRWAMRMWGFVPVRHTSKIVSLVEEDRWAVRPSSTRWPRVSSRRTGTSITSGRMVSARRCSTT
jgi:hypothetical protein